MSGIVWDVVVGILYARDLPTCKRNYKAADRLGPSFTAWLVILVEEFWVVRFIAGDRSEVGRPCCWPPSSRIFANVLHVDIDMAGSVPTVLQLNFNSEVPRDVLFDPFPTVITAREGIMHW
jgi:hypothetical protein